VPGQVRRWCQAADNLVEQVGWTGTVIDRLLHSLSKEKGPGSLQSCPSQSTGR
jgi:hypothetical protein